MTQVRTVLAKMSWLMSKGVPEMYPAGRIKLGLEVAALIATIGPLLLVAGVVGVVPMMPLNLKLFGPETSNAVEKKTSPKVNCATLVF
jgi:hypothetical protein